MAIPIPNTINAPIPDPTLVTAPVITIATLAAIRANPALKPTIPAYLACSSILPHNGLLANFVLYTATFSLSTSTAKADLVYIKLTLIKNKINIYIIFLLAFSIINSFIKNT